jgi:beta-N-acetylglucosaminidase
MWKFGTKGGKMLEDIFKRNSRIMLRKMLYIFIIINLLSYIFIFLLANVSKAATDDFSKYPGYQELINELKKEFPKSEFKMLKTGLDWNQVIKNETTASHGRNLTSNSASEWVCPVCKNKQYEPGWYCASEATVAYYMDPRNSLNTNDVFQFELLNYNSDVQDESGVKWIVSDCNYLQGKINYTATDGSTKTINKTYTQVIVDAGKKFNISPYHLASRIRQEQGPGNATETATGNGKGKYNKGYAGYYNYYNIGATGGTTATIIKNALEKAKKENWTDPEKAIVGGAEFVRNEYIGYGQNTSYLQKFDVDNSDGDLYWHQYMTNVSASKTEGQETRNAYSKMGKLNKNSHFIFSIPVFENMPKQRCELPGTNSIVTQNVEVNSDNVRVMEKKGEGKELARLNKGDKILRIELAQTQNPDGRFMRYWDKVVLADGRKGYAVRNYLTQIADITNCNEKYIVTAYTNFRNGPGVTNTTIIETLSPGQELTVIEKDKYKNVDGESWYRVKLPDGRQGYVGNGYIEKWTDTSGYDQVKVVNNSGVNVRETPGTGSKVLTTAYKGDIMTRMEKNASDKDGYIWDKVNYNGIIGYVARGDSKEDYIVPVDEEGNGDNNGSGDENIPSKNNQVKMDGKQVICDAVSNVNTIKSAFSGAVVKDGKGKEITGKTNVGTGYTVTVNKKTYTIVKKGDVNGDANINSGDLLKLQKHLLKDTNIAGTPYGNAADSNNDGKLNSGDLLKIQKFLLKDSSNINI